MAYKSPVSTRTSSSVEIEQSVSTNNNENKESTTLLWFDPNFGSHEDPEQTKQRLRHINNYVIFYTDLHECITFIQSIEQEKVFLITSGSKAAQILPLVASFRQVDSIFIFCMKKSNYEYLLDEYSKIIGVYANLNYLYKSIKLQTDLLDKQLQTFAFFDRNQKSTKDLSKQSGKFLWFQLFNYVINSPLKNKNAKRQMIDMCKQYYRGNTKQIKLIHQFENEYQSKHAIYWYSKQSFVYQLINKALRTEDIDQLYVFRFFIRDLSKNLQEGHQKILSSNEDILIVYRGAKLDKEEFDKLNENQGKLISTNGYLSTSRFKAKTIAFILKSVKRTDLILVLFQIKCHIKQIGKHVAFADIAEFSEYPDEQEVLFDLNASFTIESIQDKGLFQLIKMNLSNEGNEIMQDFIFETQDETGEQSNSIIFGRLMCNLRQYDKSQKYFEQLLNDPNGEDIAWIEFNIGRALDYKGQWEEAREYYDHAYDRMMKSKPPRIKDSAYVFNSMGVILYRQGKYDKALDYCQQALEVREKYYPSDHIGIAKNRNNIGNILRHQRKYDEAVDYYQRALEILEKYYPSGHVDIAAGLNNIGGILSDQGKYDEALDYCQRALEMQKKYYPSSHVDIATSLYNIGNIFDNQRKYGEALDYYKRALKMQKRYYPSGRIDFGKTLNNIGLCYENQNKKTKALDYYQRAFTIYQKFLPAGHPSRHRTENNIRRLIGDK